VTLLDPRVVIEVLDQAVSLDEIYDGVALAVGR
jgi:hypothetical protein